jgi:hypothetical protein
MTDHDQALHAIDSEVRNLEVDLKAERGRIDALVNQVHELASAVRSNTSTSEAVLGLLRWGGVAGFALLVLQTVAVVALAGGQMYGVLPFGISVGSGR